MGKLEFYEINGLNKIQSAIPGIRVDFDVVRYFDGIPNVSTVKWVVFDTPDGSGYIPIHLTKNRITHHSLHMETLNEYITLVKSPPI